VAALRTPEDLAESRHVRHARVARHPGSRGSIGFFGPWGVRSRDPSPDNRAGDTCDLPTCLTGGFRKRYVSGVFFRFVHRQVRQSIRVLVHFAPHVFERDLANLVRDERARACRA
jgi:hypothetical protein